MGGVNCPPPRKSLAIAGLREEYIKNLALYCKELFSGAELFFASNVKIEESILSNQSNVQKAIEVLSKSEIHFNAAISKIGSVASLYEQLSEESVFDFGSQLSNLCDVVNALKNAQLEMSILSTMKDLQEELWDNPCVTKSLVETCAAISKSVAWQANFAEDNLLVKS